MPGMKPTLLLQQYPPEVLQILGAKILSFGMDKSGPETWPGC
jgi:hypothetical protein